MNETPVVPAVPAPEVPKKKKKPAARRVGTFTMGLCLIFGGVLLCLYLINPSFQLLKLLKFSPLVLVSLGAELLICNFRFPKARLRYDFLSVLVCFFVLLAGVTGFAVSVVTEMALTAPARLDDWRDEIRQTCADVLADEPIAAVGVEYTRYIYDWDTLLFLYETDLNDLYSDSDLRIDLALSGSFDGAEDFAKQAKAVIRILHENGLHPGHLHISGSSTDEDQLFYLQLDGLFAYKLPEAELQALAEAQ